MTFYALHIAGRELERLSLLENACKALHIKFQALNPRSFDFSKPSPVKKGDIVYRISRGGLLHPFEKFLVKPGVTTFYANSAVPSYDPFVLTKHSLPCPQTIFCASRKRKMLMQYVEKLGGFPIIVKALGGTRGMGVMKVDSYTALFGIVDYLLADQKLITLQEYIPERKSARFIVLGRKIIGSMEYQAKDLDFRTNEAKFPNVVPKKYPREAEKLAVQATEAVGVEFSGVDILVHKKRYYITEVNFPCNFVRAQTVLKKDVAREMVRYLWKKSKTQ